MDPFIGEIRPFAGNFAPSGWALCSGQLLQIRQNSALFSILGTTYGGDGITTFGLPNLSGRVAMGMGSGPGLTPRVIGEVDGETQVTLTTDELAAHSHSWTASSDIAASNTPGNGVTATTSTQLACYQPPDNNVIAFAPSAVTPAGGSQPHDNMQPYLAITYIIALAGVFPSRG